MTALRNRFRRLRGEGGYTLVELITVVGIMGGVVTTLSSVLLSGTRAEIDLQKRFEAHTSAVASLDRLRRDVHCASGATTTGSSVTLTVPCAASGVVTWCTAGSAGRFSLHRLPSNGVCNASAARFADYLTTGSVFAYEQASINSLPRLRVELPVRLDPDQTTYRLCDVLVLRNGVRSGAVQPAVAPC